MTNKEWLDYLAHNAPDELAAWFDAEHVEHQERALDGNTEPESSNTDAVSERYATAFRWLDRLDYGKGGVIGCSLCDTPEQGEVVMPLESWREYLGTESENEDSREKLEADIRQYANPEGNTGTLGACWERKMLEFLDRQAAITEEKTRYKWVTASAEEIAAWRSKAEKMKEQVYELTAERDNWKANCEDWKKDCERYRSKFGKCIDYADAIHALMDDEGMA